jgi:hypothetical protein
MKKILKKWGDSLVIIFDKEDKEIYKLERGKIIDLTITEVKDAKKRL